MMWTKLTLQIFLSVATCQKLLLENQKEISLTRPNTWSLPTDEGTNCSHLAQKWNNVNYSRLRQNLHKQPLTKSCTEISDMAFRAGWLGKTRLVWTISQVFSKGHKEIRPP